MLWSDVEAQWVVQVNELAPRLGLVQLYKYNAVDQFAYLSVILDPSARGSGWPMESVLLALNYAFMSRPLRKVYVESPSFVASQFSSAAGRHMREEGRLAQHHYFNGAFHDLIIYSVSENEWRTRPPLGRRDVAQRAASTLPYSFAEFAELLLKPPILQSDLEVAVLEAITGGTELVVDLELDSIQLLEVIIAVEELAGSDVAGEALPDVESLQDLYEYYLRLTERVNR